MTEILKKALSIFKEEYQRNFQQRKSTEIANEYADICDEIYDSEWYSTAFTPQTTLTLRKNRYTNILPYEHTRVAMENDDYINANYIAGGCYIAGNAPVPSAIEDYWKMIWDLDIVVVLMLTNFVERGILKADMYWSPILQDSRVFGQFQVTMEEERKITPSESDDQVIYVVRRFSLSKNGVSKPIDHVHLTSWPDHGVLEDLSIVSSLLATANSLRKRNPNAPMIVHCSAGIGRSGSFIAMDMMVNSFEQTLERLAKEALADELKLTVEEIQRELRECFNIPRVVFGLRRERDGMVQTKKQYLMLYQYLDYYLKHFDEDKITANIQ